MIATHKRIYITFTYIINKRPYMIPNNNNIIIINNKVPAEALG
jgi:hypothetical protein